MDRPRILVVCPTDWERAAIAAAPLCDRYEFVICCEELYDSIGLWRALRFDVFDYLRGVVRRFRDAGIAGVLGTGDYPGCMFGAFIAGELGLPAPRARDAVLLSHKYYSRQHQRRTVPEATPAFALVDPRAPREPETLEYPFFVKPVKGTMSIRAQMVHDRGELTQALVLTPRERLQGWVVLRPYAQLLRAYAPEPAPLRMFIAEAPLRGRQVTVDGFVQGGVVTVMGIVDSIMYPGTMSFHRFEYPSALPAAVQARMVAIATRLMEGAAPGFDHSCFNIEMFHDEATDALSIIEINPRMSYQFSDLFERVDGMSSFAAQLMLATGVPVAWPRGAGPEGAAVSLVMRRFADARVLSVPTRAEIDAVERRFPGTQVRLLCSVGDRLSGHAQDVGSYRYCIVNAAAGSHAQLRARCEALTEMLPFVFSSPDARRS